METSPRFSAEAKLQLILASYRARNVRAFCQQHGLDPTTLYRWRRELAAAALAGWKARRPGRPAARSRQTVESLRDDLRHLAERHRALELQSRRWQVWAALAQGMVDSKAPGKGLGRLLKRPAREA